MKVICNVELKEGQDLAVSVSWNVMRGSEIVENRERNDLSLTLPVGDGFFIIILASRHSPNFSIIWFQIRGAAGLGMTGLGHGIGVGQVTQLVKYSLQSFLLKAVAIEMLITAVLVMIVFAAAADQLNTPGVKVRVLIQQLTRRRI